MSRWTHITSCISVDTCIEEPRKELVKIVKQHLKRAPKITGSERNADIFINVQTGYNSWTNADCKHCEYKDTIEELGKGFFKCGASNNYECKEGKYQTCVVISIQGDLRDRVKEETQKEFDAFLKYIETIFLVRDYSINIEGE